MGDELSAGSTRKRRRLLGLWYVLASTYLIARLGSQRLMTGGWGLDLEFLAHLLLVPAVQLLLLWLLDRFVPLWHSTTGREGG